MNQKINHPNYYGGDTTYEAIKVIEAWELGFCLGNTVKYISRAGKKNPSVEIEDLEKARWYLDRQIETLKRKGHDRRQDSSVGSRLRTVHRGVGSRKRRPRSKLASSGSH